MSLKVANQTLECSPTIIYHPDPEFISFTTARTGDDVRITIQVIHIFRMHANILGMNTSVVSLFNSVFIAEKGRQPEHENDRDRSMGCSG